MGSKAGEIVVRTLASAGAVVLAGAVALAGPQARAQAREGTAERSRAVTPQEQAQAGTRVEAHGAPGDVRAGAPAGASTRAAAWDDDEGRPLFTFKDRRINESSGLAVSPTHPDVYYTHNDSSAAPVFYAVGPNGRTRATFNLRGASARDWEGMAASKDPATGRGVLWFADIGDNFDGAWPDVSVYRVDEPAAMRDATLPAVRYRFRYEDGKHNAESVMVHPRTGRLYIVTKQFAGGVYAAPKRLRTDRINVLRRVGSAPIMATDAAYAPDGSSFVIRTYFSATVYRAPGKEISRVSMPPLEQAESIAYTPDGRALLTGSEGVGSPVYRVPLPERVLREIDATRAKAAENRKAAPTPTGNTEGRATTAADAGPDARGDTRAADADAGVPNRAVALWLAVAAGATGVITFIARRAR
ncbi:hypothetical protein [Streptosporangium pseudovulgare]|uniref:WD40 repeat domain-containing protein n=1 Tax=Streptosporangium pseudovulgare TaxID=35765 RepID=A0ABQ2QPN5_9ACTN|nr:hypothetical protein [Streptosporangium pseudovulgare]GGP90196.1 hypothetical protein GCM10010140_19850 [Streptosporangium pseudovulgare]